MLKRAGWTAAAMIGLGSCGTLWAQSAASPGEPGHHGGRGPERELQELTQVLSLTADQQTQVKGLLTERRQTVEALRRPAADASAETATATPAGPARQAQMEAIRTYTDNKIAALLTGEQKTKFAAYQQGRKDRMARWQGGAPAAAEQPKN